MVRPGFSRGPQIDSAVLGMGTHPVKATGPLPGGEALSPPTGGPASGPGMRTSRCGQLGGHGPRPSNLDLASCLSPMPGSSHAVLRNPVSTPASAYATALMAHRLTQPAQLSNAHSVARNTGQIVQASSDSVFTCSAVARCPVRSSHNDHGPAPHLLQPTLGIDRIDAGTRHPRVGVWPVFWLPAPILEGVRRVP
jgi:hypothetical protein